MNTNKYIIIKSNDILSESRIKNYLEKGITLINSYIDENKTMCYRFLKNDIIREMKV